MPFHSSSFSRNHASKHIVNVNVAVPSCRQDHVHRRLYGLTGTWFRNEYSSHFILTIFSFDSRLYDLSEISASKDFETLRYASGSSRGLIKVKSGVS